MAGLYIHIPFCASRCIYCGFYSTTHGELQDKYVDALCTEMSLRRNETQDSISTVYLGGGTPSTLSHSNLQRLLQYIYKVYDVEPDAEITMECNPDDVDGLILSDLPINRVSMGIQTFSDQRLRFLHRRHNARQATDAIERLRNSGIKNISIDLMFGFPNETLDDWTFDLKCALALQPEHISAYSLMYEEGTVLGKMLSCGKVCEIDEELSLRMYDTLCDTLQANNYEHYEISNFARYDGKGSSFRSRHNSSYWHDIPYIGIGAAAHSYAKGTRSWNIDDLQKYIDALAKGHRPAETETISDDTHYDDIITTMLRTKEGIDISSLKETYRKHLLRESKKHIEQGLLNISDHHLSLTRKGIYVSDMIMADLMYCC